GQLVAEGPLRQPAVAARRGPAERRGCAAADPDRRPRLLHGTRPEADVVHAPRRPVVLGVLVEERLRHDVDRLVEELPPAGELHAEGVELPLEVAGADAEDDAPTGERVEREERLRRQERVAVRRDPDVGEEPHAAGRGGEEAEGRDRVVPDGRHRRRLRARHADVVAPRDVEAPDAIARLRDTENLRGAGGRLPRLREDGALGRDGELEPPHEPALGDDPDGRHSVGVNATGIRLMPWMNAEWSLSGGAGTRVSGRRWSSSSNITRISRRARFAPRQKWGPPPPKPTWSFGVRVTSNRYGSGNAASSRFAELYQRTTFSPARTSWPRIIT